MIHQVKDLIYHSATQEIPKWSEPLPPVLDWNSALDALTDYVLQVNYDGYKPDRRKVLSIRASDRSVSLRNAALPIRQEVYYFIEEELFPKESTTRLRNNQTPAGLAEELLKGCYEQLCIWAAYDFTQKSSSGFRKPFDHPLIIKGSPHPNPQCLTRHRPERKNINPQFFQPDPLPHTSSDPALLPDLSIEDISQFLNHQIKTDFRNILPEGDNPPIWDSPVIGVASAHDPLFERFQDPEVVGPGHRLPGEWLPGAESVISFFLPYSEEIFATYQKNSRYASLEYVSGKWNGSKFLNVLRRGLTRFLEQRGGTAIAPALDPRYGADGFLPYWSERHIALAAGVGTFGLHQGLITEKGTFGRLGSVITTLKLSPTERPYTEVYGYCLYAFDGSCRACIDRCPSQAIADTGKLPGMCLKNGNSIFFKDWGYGACGHCSTFVPCSRKIPAKISKSLSEKTSS